MKISQRQRRWAVAILTIVAVQAVRLAALRWEAPDVLRDHTSFRLRAIPAGATVSQVFDVRSRGLAGVRIDAETSGSREMDVRLVRLSADGTERDVLGTRVSAAPGCCEITFDAIADSQLDRFRLDVPPRSDGAQLTLRVTPADRDGGLLINGRPIAANVMVGTVGAGLLPLPGALRFGRVFLFACFVMIDSCVLVIAMLLFAGGRARTATAVATFSPGLD